MDKNDFIQLAKDTYRLTLLFPSKEPLRYKIRETADNILAAFVLKENDYLGGLKAQLEVIDSFFEIALAQDWTAPVKIRELKDGYIGARLALEELEARAAAAPQTGFKSKEPDFIMVEEREEPARPQIIVAPAAPLKPMVMSAPIPVKIKELEEDLVPAAQDAEGEEPEDDGNEGGPLTASQAGRQQQILEFLKQKGGAQVWEIQKIFPDISKRTIRRDFRSLLKQGVIERIGERNTTAYKLKINLA